MEVVAILFLTLHLLAMNLAAAGPLVCIALRGSTADDVGRRLAWHSTTALIAGSVLGAAILYLPPNDALWESLKRFPPRAWWHAGIELVFSLACMVAYAASWRRLERHGFWHDLIAFVASTNLLYHFPPMMVIVGKLAASSAWTLTPVIDRPALRQLMLRGDVLALSVHFVLASIAVAAVTALVMLARLSNLIGCDVSSRRVLRRPAVIALVATALQLPAGLWLLSAMSHVSRGSLMGTSLIASLTFLAAMILALLLAGRLLAVAVGETPQADALRAGWLLIAVVLLMTAALRTSRAEAPVVDTATHAPLATIQRISGT